MERKIYKELVAWKDNPKHKPLILLGARQVGKTYILKLFGKREFDNMLYINCHNNPVMQTIFSDFNIERIVYQLSQAYEHKITPGKTLLFFDEIQEIPNGIPSLKYFCEDMSNLHVVVAGSLLGISLRSDESYPVGKVDNLRMYPMTFDEFLLANGREMLAQSVRELDWQSMALNNDVLVDYMRQYFFTGGMPEAVSVWLEGHDAKATRKVQHAIISAYMNDMGKHTKTDAMRISQIWNSIPSQLAKENKKFIFGAIKKGARANDFERAIQWLCNAGLIYKVERVTKPVEPLKFYADSSAFKIYLLDHGLLACICGARSSEMLIGNNVFEEFKGAFTENYVLTQLKSLEKNDDTNKNVFYYSKDNSQQEIDFVVQGLNRIIPTEVKAEENVHAKSLRYFVEEDFKSENFKGLRCSMKQYVDQEWMENIPLYSVEAFFENEKLGTDA
ncbi:MAG: ATP-binding protein [Bacteroidaceae bacterium]|nr:ATP-binding protein [Bacteroidaceae bacterium]